MDRNAAAKSIRTQYPTLITKSFKLHYVAFSVNTLLDRASGYNDFTKRDKERIMKLEDKFDKMKNAGFITYSKKKIIRNMFSQRLGNMIYDITPTDKMNKLIHKRWKSSVFPKKSSVEVIVGQIEFDEVTGIIERGENAKRVEYMTKPSFNDISKYFEINDYERKPPNRSVYFQKYDDGWRMMK